MAFQGITIINGNMADTSNGIILDEGLNFGRGVFETMPVMGSIPLFLEQHCERMNKGLEALFIDRIINPKAILKIMHDFKIQNCVVKLLATSDNLVLSTRENTYVSESYERGFRVRTSPLKRNPHSIVTYHKTLNYTDSIIVKNLAKKDGFDEVIFNNVYGKLAEGSMSNLFFTRNGKIHTPAVKCGILDGIIRNWVIRNFKVEEGEYTFSDLLKADEVFLSNSVMGIMPVYEIYNDSENDVHMCDLYSRQYERNVHTKQYNEKEVCKKVKKEYEKEIYLHVE